MAEFSVTGGCHRGVVRYRVTAPADEVCHCTIGTLDGGVHPGRAPETQRHIYVGSKLPWWHIADDLRQDEES